MRRVFEHLARHARERPKQVAIAQVIPCTRRVSWSWSQLHTAVHGVADQVRKAIGPGQVVLLSSPNRPEFIAAFLGTLAADAIVFPVHPALTAPELHDAARRANAGGIIACASTLALLSEPGMKWLDIESIASLSEVDAPSQAPLDRAGLMLQSSGTTGRPKIVLRSARALHAVAASICQATNLNQRDTVLAAIPLGHSYGVEHGVLAPVLAGAAVHVMDGFEPSIAAEQLGGGVVTVFPGVPLMWQMLAERAPCLHASRVRVGYSAGGPLPRHVFDACLNGMHIRVGQLYGSTEAGSVTFNDPHDSAHDPASVGRPMDDVSILLVDPDALDTQHALAPGIEGHVAIRSPSMLDRYVDDPMPAHHHGFFLSGDLGRMDARGHLTITGRVKLQIDVAGGFKVNPLEVEDLLVQHPAVKECVVVPLPITETASRLKAIVVLKREALRVSTEDLRQFARARLAAHKVPRLIEVRASLPRSPGGKVLREKLRCE